MSSKIVINIVTQGDDEAVLSEQMAVSDTAVPAPPASDNMGRAGADNAATGAFVGAPAPPQDASMDNDIDMPAEGPPSFSDDISSFATATDLSGGAPSPPSNHPDIAGDVTGVLMSGSGASPAPPQMDSDMDDEKSNEKGKKGSGGKKKK
jgi:hypothetical protein